MFGRRKSNGSLSKNYDRELISRAVYLVHLLVSNEPMNDLNKQVIEILTNAIKRSLIANDTEVFISCLKFQFYVISHVKNTYSGITSGFFEHEEIKKLLTMRVEK